MSNREYIYYEFKLVKERQYRFDKNDISRNLLWDAVPIIGSAMSKTGGVFKGDLSTKELAYLMPTIVGIYPSDNLTYFTQKVDEYFSNIRIKPVKGYKLNVSLEDDTAPLAANNMPVALIDYISYRYARKHPFVADSLIEAQGKQDAAYYLYNHTENTNKKKEILALVRKANAKLSEVVKQEDYTDAILQVAYNKGEITANPNYQSTDEQEIAVQELATKSPKFFLECLDDKTLKPKGEIFSLVEKGIIELVGSSYSFRGTEIGNSVDSVVAWWAAPKNSKIKAQIISMGNIKDEIGEDRFITNVPTKIEEGEV